LYAMGQILAMAHLPEAAQIEELRQSVLKMEAGPPAPTPPATGNPSGSPAAAPAVQAAHPVPDFQSGSSDLPPAPAPETAPDRGTPSLQGKGPGVRSPNAYPYWWEVCEPQDAFQNPAAIDESLFAATLGAVHAGTARREYQDPSVFLAHT